MKTLQLFILLLGLLLVGSLKTPAQQTGKIAGTVSDKDSNVQLSGVSIILTGPDTLLGTITNLDGFFEMTMLTPDRYTIEISHKNYNPRIIKKVVLNKDIDLVLNIKLTPLLVNYESTVTRNKQKNSGDVNQD